MKKTILLYIYFFASLALNAQQSSTMDIWLTNPGNEVYFKKQGTELRKPNKKSGSLNTVIFVDPNRSYQSIDGFGYTLTGGSAQHLLQMSKAARTALIKEMFATDENNIGTSYLRLSIGASDLNEFVFSYNDLPAGQTDTAMQKFNLGQDKKDVIPVLKEILKVSPQIKLMGSPWSPPVWMKTNGDTRGGSLKPEYYPAYAKYLVKYVQAMKKEGITIDAITVQNEPLHPGNNPSLLMLAKDQAVFVRDHLGPAFKKASLKTKIIIYDHNADKPEYPISILDDPEAKKYIDGSAFHMYGGKIDALSKVHDAHPDKNLYFTEQWVGAPGNMKGDILWHVEQLIIGATRNWSKTVLEWNLSSNPQLKPYTDRGGCDRCLGAVSIDKDSVSRKPAYYIIAHAAKWVRPGSVRIFSDMRNGLPNVAFKTPSGKMVLVVANTSDKEQLFDITTRNGYFTVSLSASSVASYIW